MSHSCSCEEEQPVTRQDALDTAFLLIQLASEQLIDGNQQTSAQTNAQVLNQIAQSAILLAQSIPVPTLPDNVVPIGLMQQDKPS